MAEADLARKWPELEKQRAEHRDLGVVDGRRARTDAERALLQEVLAAMDKARREKDAPELERQMRLASRLSRAAFHRTTEAWEYYFEDAASEISKMKDLPKAQKLSPRAKAAQARATPPSSGAWSTRCGSCSRG